jgi:Secretory lipase
LQIPTNRFQKTTELQPSYAPDVNIAGAALGGIIPNLTHQIGKSLGVVFNCS